MTAALVALIDEAFSGLWRARRMTVLSIALIALSVFLVGAFFLVAENLRGVVETVREETAVTIFLKEGIGDEEKENLAKVARDSRLVTNSKFVSAEEARNRFTASWRSLSAVAATLPTNPFPASLELDLTPDAASSQALQPLLSNLARQPGVDEVQFDVEWIRRLRGIVNLVRAGGAALGVLLALGAAFTIANVVRLTILLHRDEIEILRLVGAPEMLIRGPFLLGGLVQGLLGGAAAVALLAAAFHGVVRYVAATSNALLGVFVVRFLDVPTMVYLAAGGLLAGLVGGAIAVRRNLPA